MVAINPVALLNACQMRPLSVGSVALLHLVSQQEAELIVYKDASLQIFPVTHSSPELFRQALVTAWETFRAQGLAQPQTVWIVGSSSDSSEAERLLSGSFGVRFSSIDIAQLLMMGSTRLEAPERFMTALGLAFQGLGKGVRVPLNLLAQGQCELRARQVRRTLLTASGLCAFVAIGFGVSGMMEINRRRQLVLQAIERRERLYQTLRPEVRAALQAQQHLERRSAQLARIAADGSAITRFITQVAAALPETVWLTKMECVENRGVVEMLLEGRARSFQDVTQLKERLQGLSGVTGFKPISTSVVADEANGKELIAFSVHVQRALGKVE
jgi:Tfp pilus assembly protein PilN